MNMHYRLQAPLLVAALLALPLAQAAMTRTDYDATKARIGVNYKADKLGCDALAANAKDICLEQAKARERIAGAELEYAYTGKASDLNQLRVTRAEATYAVARERCDDLAGQVKDVCVSEAKTQETKALADAKLGQQVGAAEQQAGEDKRAADLKLATEKCDALAGDAKAACVATAQASFGKP